MLNVFQSDGAFGPARYSGIFDCLRTSVKEEGYGVLTRGLNSTIIRAFPTNAACFYVVTSISKLVKDDIIPNEYYTEIAEILRIGDTIVKEIEFTKKAECFQNSLTKNLRDNHLANFLPIVLAASKETLYPTPEYDPIVDIQGEGHDDDTYKALSGLLAVPYMKTVTQNIKKMWIKQGAVVIQSADCRRKAIISQQILSAAL